MSQWGLSLAEAQGLSEAQVEGLLGAWLERKRFEAKIMVATVGEALKPKADGLMPLSALAAMGFGIVAKGDHR